MNTNPALESKAAQWAAICHFGQTRKYTAEPYVEHCRRVAALVAMHTHDSEIIAAAWLHDTIEDTPLLMSTLAEHFGDRVANIVYDLTDRYTKADYPDLCRAERKALEALRYETVSAEACLVKRMDMADNMNDVGLHDPKFAEVFRREKWLTQFHIANNLRRRNA